MSINDPQDSHAASSAGSSANLPVVTDSQKNTSLAFPEAAMPWPEARGVDEGVNLVRFLHSLRRRWLTASCFGILVASAVAVLLYVFIPIKYDGQALVRVRRTESSIFTMTPYGRADSQRDYETFKKTQAALMKSTFVINAALRKPGIGQLPLIKEQDDAATWLTEELRISNPEDSEILSVSLKGRNKQQIEKIVNAVVESYFDEIVQNERENDLERFNILKRSYRKSLEEVKEKQELITQIAQEVGAPDSQQVELKHKLELDQLMRLKTQRERIFSRLQDVETNWLVLTGRRQAGNFEPSEFEIEDQLDLDPIYAEAKYHLQLLQNESRSQVATGSSSPQLQRALQEAYAQVERLKAEMRPRAVDRIRRLSGLGEGKEKDLLQMLDTERIILANQVQKLDTQYVAQETVVASTIGNSAELELRKAELEMMAEMMKTTKTEMDTLDLNLKKRPRINVIQQAIVPEESDWVYKLALILVAFTAVLGSTGFGVAFWDYQARRINVSDDVNTETGVRVVGSLPTLDRRSGSIWPFGGLRGSTLEAVLIESIDSVRTALLCSNGDSPVNVVMVTSATAQEGKTTLAGQLAISLARSGRRTLLVDADVHNPQQHYVFGVPFDRGFCELLRQEGTLDELVQHVSVEGLSLISSGYCDQASLRALASENTQKLISQLRGEFDFIVIDSGPVLVGADPLLLGQYADTVLLSVRRDISRLPKINEACDRLRAVGVNIMGAVLNGASVEYRRPKLELAYDSTADEQLSDQ